MNPLRVVSRIISLSERSPSQGLTNSIIFFIEDISDTGHSVSPQVLINLSSSNRRELLLNQLASHHHWLCEHLDRMVSVAATVLGFGRNGFELTFAVIITHQTVAVPPPSNNNNEQILRTVLVDRIDSEGLKSLKMETEPCSICLDNLSGSDSKHGVPTRMTCSHVFHRRCISEWLQRKNTCPLCRTVLYDP